MCLCMYVYSFYKRPQCNFSTWDNKVCWTWLDLTWPQRTRTWALPSSLCVRVYIHIEIPLRWLELKDREAKNLRLQTDLKGLELEGHRVAFVRCDFPDAFLVGAIVVRVVGTGQEPLVLVDFTSADSWGINTFGQTNMWTLTRIRKWEWRNRMKTETSKS